MQKKPKRELKFKNLFTESEPATNMQPAHDLNSTPHNPQPHPPTPASFVQPIPNLPQPITRPQIQLSTPIPAPSLTQPPIPQVQQQQVNFTPLHNHQPIQILTAQQKPRIQNVFQNHTPLERQTSSASDKKRQRIQELKSKYLRKTTNQIKGTEHTEANTLRQDSRQAPISIPSFHQPTPKIQHLNVQASIPTQHPQCSQSPATQQNTEANSNAFQAFLAQASTSPASNAQQQQIPTHNVEVEVLPIESSDNLKQQSPPRVQLEQTTSPEEHANVKQQPPTANPHPHQIPHQFLDPPPTHGHVQHTQSSPVRLNHPDTIQNQDYPTCRIKHTLSMVDSSQTPHKQPVLVEFEERHEIQPLDLFNNVPHFIHEVYLEKMIDRGTYENAELVLGNSEPAEIFTNSTVDYEFVNSGAMGMEWVKAFFETFVLHAQEIDKSANQLVYRFICQAFHIQHVQCPLTPAFLICLIKLTPQYYLRHQKQLLTNILQYLPVVKHHKSFIPEPQLHEFIGLLASKAQDYFKGNEYCKVILHILLEYPAVFSDEILDAFNYECREFGQAAVMYIFLKKRRIVGRGTISNIEFMVGCLGKNGYDEESLNLLNQWKKQMEIEDPYLAQLRLKVSKSIDSKRLVRKKPTEKVASKEALNRAVRFTNPMAPQAPIQQQKVHEIIYYDIEKSYPPQHPPGQASQLPHPIPQTQSEVIPNLTLPTHFQPHRHKKHSRMPANRYI